LPVEAGGAREPGVVILYLFYPTGPHYRKERPIRELRRIACRLPGRKTILYIDNSQTSRIAPRQSGENEYVIGGDNSGMEFSGWQAGVEFLRNRGLPGDVCLFANDTFLARSRFHRRLLNRGAVECAARYSAMVGKRMVLDAEGRILGNPLIPYIRTHLFLLPRDVVDELGTVVSLDRRSTDRLLLPGFDPSVHLFQPDAPISRPIQDYLRFHLHSVWYRRRPYNAENFERLRGKAASILNALLLSIRVYDLGYPLVSLANVPRFLRMNPPVGRLRSEWTDRHGRPRPGNGSPPNPFWGPGSVAYRRVPASMRPFSLENVLDLLERSSHPDHL
jgi:hypothetical protein